MRIHLAWLALVACSKPADPSAATGSAAMKAAAPAKNGSAAPGGTAAAGSGAAAPGVATAAGGSAARGSASKSAKSAGSSAVVAVTPEQLAAGVKYRDAMARGRKATDAKAYAAAISAFDGALAARPNDPRALAERGFAKLLAGTELDGASADFDHASDHTRDAKLLAMIWFNRGLVDDKLGNAPQALVDYFLANQLQPSKAAAAKLAGKQVCPIRVATAKEMPSASPADGADWLALAKAMDVIPDLGEPATSDAARAAIFGDDPPQLPSGATIGAYSGKNAYVIAKYAGKLRAIFVGSAIGGRCSGSVDASVKGQIGDLVYARVTEQAGGDWTMLCGDDHHDCKPDEEQTGTACNPTPITLRDVIVDLASGRTLLVAEQPQPSMPEGTEVPDDDKRLVHASFAADGLHLSGAGCDQVLAVAK